MKNITNYINMAINFSILGLLIYLTIAIMNIKKALKKLWNWKINFIRKYPVWSKCMGWLEGIIIGLLIYHFFLKEIIN